MYIPWLFPPLGIAVNLKKEHNGVKTPLLRALSEGPSCSSGGENIRRIFTEFDVNIKHFRMGPRKPSYAFGMKEIFHKCFLGGGGSSDFSDVSILGGKDSLANIYIKYTYTELHFIKRS